ncbi:heme oxygenase-like protein [Nemania abortiva]|nr:heme oxygenase-like protein [Nemania abortiva]
MPSRTEDVPRSLSESINDATRSVHTKLNKLVISRLRLALPPQADDASQYVSGLLQVAPIYITFESLWGMVLESLEPPEKHDPKRGVPNGAKNDPVEPQLDERSGTHRPFSASPRIKSLLTNLHFEGLQRSQALKNDLTSLTGWSGRTLAEQLNDSSESPVLSDFLAHTRNSVETSPHTLLAYGWVLYMALFSGGRFIRASLEDVYPAFWVPASAQRPMPATLANATSMETQPLSFFRFDTPEDGEDLKLEFKKRFLDSEGVLTETEREEIVQEARCIFDYMIQLVDELDDICEEDKEDAEARLLSLRSRDSVVVENERRQHSVETSRRSAVKGETERSLKEDGEGHVKFK